MWLPAPDLSGLFPLRNLWFEDLSDPELLDLKDTWELTWTLKSPSPFEVFWKLLGTLLALVKSIAADDFFDLAFLLFPLVFGLESPEPPDLSRFLLKGTLS